MKKARLIVSIFLLTAMLGTTTAAAVEAYNTSSEQKTTNEEMSISSTLKNTPVLKSANVTDYLTKSPIKSMEDTSSKIQSNLEIKNESMFAEQAKKTSEKVKKQEKKNKKKKLYTKKLGTFKITGYCSCAQCCGKSTGITASGTKAMAGRTIAADTSKYPFGSKMVINGHTYTVEDRGGAINGNKIDIFFSSHSEALQWGVRYCEVSLVK